MGYITVEELKELIDSEKVEGKSNTSLQLLIDAAKELIDGYCKKEFPDPVPSIVKITTMELVRVMLNDTSRESESIGDYSFKNNPKAYDQILKKLDNLIETATGGPVKRPVRAMVI